MKIASYIQNGKRFDIIIPEVKGVLIPLPFSKGGNVKAEELIIKEGKLNEED